MRILFITFAAACIAFFSSSISLKAQDWGDNESTTEETTTELEVSVTLFAKANFEGKSLEINELTSFDSQTIQEEFGMQPIASIKVSEGVIVRVFMADDFEGESFDITSDMKALPAKWVGKIRSFELVVAEQGGNDEGW
ncbi:hypothetical protein [Bernardetia sp.]|uniref:hypothetical protein n=1 Tax=Bernardetia sp. TaxID=1937974 RepID=UPI0025B9A4B1|nr:hypothetical protein [Bernardetia sp.]